MPTWVTPISISQSRKPARSRFIVPKVRVARDVRRPAAPMITQATTEPWCTSSPAARSTIASIPASFSGGGRGATGGKTEVGPRAGRTGRPRHSVIPEHGADRFLQRGRVPPIQIRPPRIRHPQYRSEPLFVLGWPHFHSRVVRSMRGAFLPRFAWIMPQAERVGAVGRNWPGRSFAASA